MFSKIQSMFKAQENPQTTPLNHPGVDGSDISQCPYAKNQQNKMPECPVKGKTNSPKANLQSDEESQEEEKPRGGCPFMNSSDKKKNPNLGINCEGGYDQPFISKFKYYLSDSKINFSALRKGKVNCPMTREQFDRYPIYLKHTLFYKSDDFRKIRNFECCSRFMAYEELRERGNKYFNKGKFKKALDYYEQSLSLFRWLEYHEESSENLEQIDTLICQIPSRSEISEEQMIGSKIKLNFEEDNKNQQGIEKQTDQKFSEFEEKYKQFFVIYADSNVKYSNGEQMDETTDIDMRRSLLLQLYLNMAAAYINLNHYSLAHKILDDAFQLSDRVSQVYLRKAQATLSNKGATIEQLKISYRNISKALQMQPNEKIFQNTNKNILKMVNIHDAPEVYAQVALKITNKIKELTSRLDNDKLQIENRLVEIKEIQSRMISQGKNPREGKVTVFLSHSQQYKILSRIYTKYVRIMDFFTETKDPEQLRLAKQQFQQILYVINQIKLVQGIQINYNNFDFGTDQFKVQNRVARIKRQKCDEIYNGGKYNFQVLEWAIKQVVDEQYNERKAKEAQEKEDQSSKLHENISNSQKIKSNLLGKLPFALIIVPIIGIAVNYLII